MLGALPVCDGERLVGMLTDRDIVVRAIAVGQDPKRSTVRDAMTPQLVYGYEDQDVQEAAHPRKRSSLSAWPFSTETSNSWASCRSGTWRWRPGTRNCQAGC